MRCSVLMTMRSSGAVTRKRCPPISATSGARRHGPRDGRLFAGLSQPSRVNFNEFRKSRHNEIPLLARRSPQLRSASLALKQLFMTSTTFAASASVYRSRSLPRSGQ